MSLTNFISLLGTAGANVDRPRTHFAVQKTGTNPSTVGTVFYKLNDDNTYTQVLNDNPFPVPTFENFSAADSGFNPIDRTLVFWQGSTTYNGSNFVYRNHMSVYDVSDPDNPVRTTAQTSSLSNTNGVNQKIPEATLEESTGRFITNVDWYNDANNQVRYFGPGSQIGGFGSITYTPSAYTVGNIEGKVLYDEAEDLLFVSNRAPTHPGRVVYVAQKSTMSSAKFLAQVASGPSAGLYAHLLAIDKARKIVFTIDDYDLSGNYGNTQFTVQSWDYSNYPTVNRLDSITTTSGTFQPSTFDTLAGIHDDELKRLFVISSVRTDQSSLNNPYFYLNTSDASNLSWVTQSRTSYQFPTSRCTTDYDPVSKVGLILGQPDPTNDYVSKFTLGSSGVSFNYFLTPTAGTTPVDDFFNNQAFNVNMYG